MNENENLTLDDMRASLVEKYGNDDEVTTPEEPEEVVAEKAEVVTETEPEATEETTPVEQPKGTDLESAMKYAAEHDRNTALEAEIASLREQLAKEKQLSKETALKANEVVAEQLGNTSPLPTLNFDELMYLSEEDRAKAVAEYNTKLIEIAAKQATADMLGKISPLMKQYDDAVADRQMSKAFSDLATLEGFADISGRETEIKGIMARPEFASMPMAQRVTLAALIDKGVEATRPKAAVAEPDLNSQADAILANPELMKILTARNARDVHDKNAGVPTHTAGGGFVNAAFKTPERPQTIEEIRAKYNAY